MKLLSLARDLKRRRSRERQQMFVAEGVRAVEELVASELEVVGVVLGPEADQGDRRARLAAAIEHRGLRVERVDDRELASAAETESPQGIVAIAAVPQRSFTMLEGHNSLRVILLDGVQDPGNVGTIVRTAAALGASATIAMPGTVDLWNAKVVRSGMGAHFKHTAFHATWQDFDAFRIRAGLELWGAEAEGDPIGTSPPPARLGIVVGNEGSGLSAEAKERCGQSVSLPIERVESLNVAVAAGILLFELRS